MANIVPVTVSYEVSEPVKGQYEVKEATEEQQCVGYYDPDTKTIGAFPRVFGRQIGDGYSGSLETGLGIQLVLAAYNGSLRFNKIGNELKAYLHLKPLLPWGDSINYEATVLHL